MIALDPQVQRYALEANRQRANQGDRPHPDIAAHRSAATRAELPAAGAFRPGHCRSQGIVVAVAACADWGDRTGVE